MKTAPVTVPLFDDAVPGPFPVATALHGKPGYAGSIEVRYDPSRSIGEGGPTWMWLRNRVAIVAGEEPTGFQRICPLADSGNGASYNESIDRVRFVNPDLTLALFREPRGEWFLTKAISHWQQDGTGLADAELSDVEGPVGRAVQTLLLDPA